MLKGRLLRSPWSNCRNWAALWEIQRLTYAETYGRIELKFDLILAFMTVLVTCKNEEDPIKMKEIEC